MIKVLVVEDSPVARELLVHILSADPDVTIAGVVHDGDEALEAVARERPDVITMDIHMPRMNGLEATRRIMETHPTPIVIVSGTADPRETEVTFRAMEAGALAVLARPEGVAHDNHHAAARELLQTVKLMSEVRVVRRWSRAAPRASRPSAVQRALALSNAEIKVVAFGASTGGPPVLQTILSQLPKNFPVPVLIVQHMASGFIEGFVKWLGHSSAIPVRIARNGEATRASHAYVAPDGYQMKVERNGRIALTKDEPESVHRPSVSYLFRALAESYEHRAAAVLLSGMGRDGADELKALRLKGAITFAQDRETSAVFGMPQEAIRLDAATYVLSPEQIAAALATIANDRK